MLYIDNEKREIISNEIRFVNANIDRVNGYSVLIEIIYAYNKNSLDYEAESKRTISNIVPYPDYVPIDKGSYYIIKLNYPNVAATKEYKWKQDGVWKEYDSKGILLIKPEYKDEIEQTNDGIIVEDENGREVIFTDHYYFIDVAMSELMENLFMRWENSKPDTPTSWFQSKRSLPVLRGSQQPER